MSRGFLARSAAIWMAGLLVATTLWVIGPSTARAANIDVTYSLSGFFCHTNCAPNGNRVTINSGTAVVRYLDPGTDGTIPAQIQAWDADMNGSLTFFISQYFRGPVATNAGSQLPGSLTAGGNLSLPLALTGAGDLLYRTISGSTQTRNVSFTLDSVFRETGVSTAVTQLTITAIGTLGAFDGRLVDFGRIFLTEVSRTTVPEPSSGTLVAGSLLASLAVAGAWRRRSRTRTH